MTSIHVKVVFNRNGAIMFCKMGKRKSKKVNIILSYVDIARVQKTLSTDFSAKT